MTTPKPRYLAAIDPDLDKSGLAIYDRETQRFLFYKSVEFDLIIPFIKLSLMKKNEVEILIEAGWIHKKSNFRKTEKRGISEAIARKVGQNQAVGKLLTTILTKAGYNVTEIPPLAKSVFKQKGRWTKLGKDYLTKETGLISPRINDEVRDAIFICLRYK